MTDSRTFNINVPEFNDINDYKNRNNATSKNIEITLLDIERHLITCNPWGLSDINIAIRLYDIMLRYLIDINSENSQISGPLNICNDLLDDDIYKGDYYLKVKENILRSETTFKTSHSFLLGMVFTSLMAEKCFDAVPLKITHFTKIDPKNVNWKKISNKYHPDFFAPVEGNTSGLIFDAKGSLSSKNGYISNERIDHGGEQINAVKSVEFESDAVGKSNKPKIDTYGAGTTKQLKRFIGSVATKVDKINNGQNIEETNSLRICSIDPENEGGITFSLNKNEMLKEHYEITGTNSSTISLDSLKLSKVNFKNIEIYSPKNHDEVYDQLISDDLYHSAYMAKVRRYAEKQKADYSVGNDGIFLLKKK